MLLVPLFCFVTALGFAGFGIAMAATVAKIDQFNYVTALFVTPLFLVSGAFFPIDELPEGVQVVCAAQSRCTSWSNWSAAAPSASRRSTWSASPSSSPSPSSCGGSPSAAWRRG